MKNNFQSNGKGRSQRVWQLLISMLIILTMGIGQMWGATTAPADTVTAHAPGAMTKANLVSANGRKYEVYFSNNASKVSWLVGSNTSTVTQATGTNKWCNIGSGCGNTNNNISTAFTLQEFVNNVKNSNNNKAIQIQSSAQSEKNIVMVVSGYDSIATIEKSEIQVYAEEWGGSSYGSASKLTATKTTTASSHTKRHYALDATKRYRLTLQYGTSGSTNKNLVGFSLCPPAYAATQTLSHVTRKSGDIAGTKAATKGYAYNVTFEAEENYALPSSITVTIGGSAAEAGTDYTWNSTTGEFNVPANKVTGAIVVAIEGEISGTPCSATADAGADKVTTVGVGVAMAATAAASGYTGAWSIKSGSPSTATSQLGTTSSNTMTFTPNTYGTYTLVWTVTDNNDGTCSASDEATVTVPAPTHGISYTNLKGMDNSANPTSYSEGTGVASFAKLRHAVGYDFTGWSPSSISSSATTDQTIDAQWTANAVAAGTGTLTYALGYSDNTITTSSIARDNGALYDATDLAWTGVTIDDSESNERSGKITTTNSYDSGKYLSLTFKIADGYTFTPTEVQLKAVAVSSDKTIRFEFTDNAGTPNTKYLEQVRANGSSVGTLTYDFDASEPVTLTGTVTVKIYAYGATNSWRLGTPITITGTVASSSCTKPGIPTQPALKTDETDYLTHNSAILDWDRLGAAANSNGYKVYIVQKDNSSNVIADWVDCNNNYYQATVLTPATTYTITVKAKGAMGYCDLGDASESFDFTTNPAPAQYTVHYMDEDGTTPLGSDELVVVGEHPVGLSPAPTKPLNSFASWQLSGSDIALNAVSAAANEEVTLTARWEKLYASTIDIEEFIDDNGTSGDWATYLSNHGYAISSTSDVSLDGGDSGNKPADKGLKIKKAGRTITFEVVANKVVVLKVGSLKGGAQIKVNEGEYADLTGASPLSTGASVFSYYYSANVATYTIKTSADDYNIIQSITITNPYQVSYDSHGADAIAAQYGTPSVTLPTPVNGTGTFKGWYDAAEGGNKIGNAGASYTPTANITLHAQWETVSSDNTLSDLQVDGATVAGFDPDVNIYYLGAYEYGQHPEITSATATAEAAGATVAISNTPVHYVDATNDFWYVQANVTPASGTPIGYNQVRYTVKPKQGVSLIKVVIPNGTGNDQDVAAANITGYISGTAVQKLESGKHKLGSKGHYIGITLASGTFQEDDIVNVNIEEITGDKLRVFSENTAAESKVVAQSAANMVAGVNTVLLDATSTNSLYLRRGTDAEDYQKGWNPFVGYFEVQRLMPSFIESFELAGVAGTIDQTLKTISVEVPYSTDITSLTPTIKAWANGGATLDKTGAQDFSSAVVYKVTSAYEEDGEVAYTVNVTKAEASHVATLSDVKLDGVSLEGFDPATLSYNVELEKGTTEYPTVTYTAATGATVVPSSEAFPGAYNLVVTAEDGTTKQTYTINFTVSTKNTVVIFDGTAATQAEALKASPDATGATWSLVGLSVSESAFTGYNYKIATGGQTGTSKHIVVTVPANYLPQFVITHVTNSDGSARNALVGTSTTRPASTEAALFYVTSSDIYNPSTGTSAQLDEETTYYIHSDQSINFLKIALLLEPLAPKAATPTLSGLADLAACTLGTDELTVTASDLDGGTAHYQWYKVVEGDDPDEAVGTDANTYAPAVVGNYYVVVTNQKDGCRDNSKKSDEVTVSVKAATEITSELANQRGNVDAVVTLEVEANGANLHYAWKESATIDGTYTNVAGAADAASLDVTITEGMSKYYKVVVSGDCGDAQESIAKVEQFVPVAQANVTNSIAWNWANAASVAEIKLTASTAPKKNEGFVMANGAATVYNNANFESDKLYLEGEYIVRDGKYFQGQTIKFNTTVAGKVRVKFSHTGNSKPARELYINGVGTGESRTSATAEWSSYVEVPAGEVTITAYHVDPADGAGQQYIRVPEIEFLALAHQRTSGYNAGDLGTVCLEDATIIDGANLYELQGLDEHGYLAFDQVDPAEQLEAGKPYLFEVTNPSKISFYKPVGAAHSNDEIAHKGMIGTFSGTTLYQNVAQNYYYFSGRHIWKVNDFSVEIPIPGHRCYIDYDVLKNAQASPNPAPGRRRVTLGVQGTQVTTDINNVGSDDVQCTKVMIDGQLYILRGEKMYDATGRLVK